VTAVSRARSGGLAQDLAAAVNASFVTCGNASADAAAQVGCLATVAREPAGPTLHLRRSLVLAALLVVVAGTRVALAPSRSNAAESSVLGQVKVTATAWRAERRRDLW